jgi:hypothetical protein
MRIVHLPTEISGQMGILCTGLREAGLEVNGYNWFHSYLNYEGGTVSTDAFELIKLLDPLIRHCDVFHFHNGNTLTPDHEDLSWIARAGKKMIMHHWGNDVRTRWRTAELNPYELPDSYMTDEEIHRQLLQLSRHIRHAIVQDAELVPHVRDYYEKVHVVPLAYPVRRVAPRFPGMEPGADRRPLRIVHAPTDRSFKGSDAIERAIAELKRDFPIEWIVVEKKSHREARSIYSRADLIIDQILCGTYGVFSVEAMALGKPVVAYIREDVRSSLPEDLPIVNANPDNIVEVLDRLLRQPERLSELGRACRAYAEKRHDVEIVVPQLISIYRQL